MLVNEMITQIREQVHDITDEYSNSILIKYINTGIKSASSILIQLRHNAVMQTITITNNTSVPTNFVKFVGQLPVTAIAGKFTINNSAYSSISAVYFASQANVKSTSDELPFTDEAILLYIEQYATILALNRNEFNVQADEQLLQALRKDFVDAMSGTGDVAK